MTTEENVYFESIRQQVNSGFLNYFDVVGKTILDVGVDVNLTTSKEFMAQGAKKVIAANPFEYKRDAIVPEGVEYLEVGAENVDFGNGFFDIVYGNSILEHINNLQDFLDRVLPKLKSGGVLYLEGSPFWTGPKGHHLYLNIPEDNVLYSVQGNCPIYDYEHLVYKKEDLSNVLISRNVPAGHIKKIVDFVYESNLLNRIKPSEIKKTFVDTGYFCKFYETFYEKQQSSKDLRQSLRDFEDFDLDLCSLEVVLIKENQIGRNFECAFTKASDSRYVPIPVQRDLSRNEIDFKMNSVNYGVDTIGLAEFEEWGTWTNSKIVVLHFLIYPLGKHSDVNVEFTVNPFLAGDKKEEEVNVYIQSKLLATWVFDTSGMFPAKREFTIPRNLIQLGHVIIELRIKNPRSPYSLGLNGDKRDLGVGLIDVKFMNKQI